MSKNRNRNRNKNKKDITLMTLLAHEATADSRRLLKKHGKEDAKNYDDLEVKLAEFYFTYPDKIGLEKELAEIHPHKKWLLRVTAPKVEVKKEPIKVQEVKTQQTIIAPGIVAEKKSNCEGDEKSSFDANDIKTKDVLKIVGITAFVAVVAIGALVVMHLEKRKS